MISKASAQRSRTGQRNRTRAQAEFSPPKQPSPPRRPSRPAPARFGVAGISAEHGARIKDTVTLRRGPVMSRRREFNGVISDHDAAADKIATALGWFSIGLGLTEV